MSGGGDGAEDHSWPAFVDVLTTMTMILTFVMLILAVAMASMMENVSKNIIERIAQSQNIATNPNATVEDLAEMVIEGMRGKSPSTTPVQSIETPEKKTVFSQAKPDEVQAAQRVEAKVSDTMLTLNYQKRATQLDDGALKQIEDYLKSNPAIAQASMFEVRAVADAGSGTLSDARRIAYYRGMVVRTALNKAGIPPEKITIKVDDTAAGKDGDVVKIYAKP